MAAAALKKSGGAQSMTTLRGNTTQLDNLDTEKLC